MLLWHLGDLGCQGRSWAKFSFFAELKLSVFVGLGWGDRTPDISGIYACRMNSCRTQTSSIPYPVEVVRKRSWDVPFATCRSNQHWLQVPEHFFRDLHELTELMDHSGLYIIYIKLILYIVFLIIDLSFISWVEKPLLHLSKASTLLFQAMRNFGDYSTFAAGGWCAAIHKLCVFEQSIHSKPHGWPRAGFGCSL